MTVAASTFSLRNNISNRMLLLICVMYFLVYVDRVNISTAAPLIKGELGLSNTELGAAFSAFAYPYALFQLIGGWLGDKFGPHRTLAVCGVVVCAATVATGAVGGLATLFLARLALGFGEGAAFPTATRAMSTWLPASQWGFAQGITHSFARIGNALTPPLVAWLVIWLSWRGSFFVLGIASLVWVAVWLWFYRDDPRKHPQITTEELAQLPGRPDAATERPPVPWLTLAGRIMPVTIVDFCYGWTLWLFLSWIPSFFFQNFHLNLKSSALFSAGVFLSGVVGDTLGGVISDRILRRTGDLRKARCWVIASGLFGGFVFLIPVVLVHDVTVVALFLSLAFFCVEMVVAPIWSVPMDIAPRYAGSASGLMNFGFGLAGIFSPLVFGFTIDLTGSWTIPFLGSMALLLIGSGLALRLRPDQRLAD